MSIFLTWYHHVKASRILFLVYLMLGCPTLVESMISLSVNQKAHQPISIKGNDASQVASRPFARSRAWNLQALQGLFMKMEALEHIFMPSQGFHVMKTTLCLNEISLHSKKKERSPWKTKWMKEGVLTQHVEQSTVHIINIQTLSSP